MYLKETPAKWGILTNGKKWRLYNEQTSDRLDTYYEIDLPTILEKDNKEEALQEFKYFYLFFKQKAFTSTKKSFLDKVFKQSEKYSQEIGENLEDRVYQALRWMAKGYFKVGTNNLEKTSKNLEKVHKNSLVFLYRLLFLFYAESNGNLGTEVPKKYEEEYSFEYWVDDILDDYDNDNVNEQGGLYNHRLKAIFGIVDEGSESRDISKDEFYVPPYNGGLFDDGEYPFLEEKKIQNKYIAKVVNLLARAPLKEESGKARVDYSDLSIRHIGGIYEGLLEYEPKIAEQDIVAEKEEWKPLKETNKDFKDFKEENRAREGEIYLATDKGERKATGSYYTPEYIVQYIVENTLQPKIEEKLEGLKTDEEKKEEILDINVLDPAMGSGHFLVDALDLLANKLVKYAPEDVEGKEIDWAKRKVVRNCLYGVDVNPLATELAKVSLWLQTMTEDKPLPFLDHHLRTGNSLVGADFKNIDKHPKNVGQEENKTESKKKQTKENNGKKDNEDLTILDFIEENEINGKKTVRDNIDQVLNTYDQIMNIKEENPENIKQEKEKYQRFLNNKILKRLKILSDVHTSYYFENNFSVDQYEELKEALLDREKWKEMKNKEWVKKGFEDLSRNNKFFHWQLEFPKVFFKGISGFDAVIGNPPYVRVQNMNYNIIDYLKEVYNASYRRIDISLLFMEKGLQLTNLDSKCSYITSIQFLKANYGTKIRENLFEKGNVQRLVDLSRIQVFPDITAYTGIITLESSENSEFQYDVVNKDAELYGIDTNLDIRTKISEEDKDFFVEYGISPYIPILSELKEEKPELKTKASVHTGLTTGNDNIMILDRDQKQKLDLSDRYTIGFLRGAHIDKYKIDLPNEEVVYPYNEEGKLINLEEIESRDKDLYNYLKGHKKELSSRKDSREEIGEEKFHSLVRKGQPSVFMSEKIVYSALSKHNQFAVDQKSYAYLCGGAGVFGIKYKGNLFYLVGVLNSKIAEFYLHEICPQKRGNYYSYIGSKVETTPLPENENSKITKLSKTRKQKTKDLETINLNIQDYLGSYSDGKTLGDLYNLVEGLSNNILMDTLADREKLRIGSVEFEEQNNDLILKASARYKPEDEEESDDLDRWGYTETKLKPAMKFSVDEQLETLIKEFIPVAVNEAGGFANFRETATKTNSPIDRLEKLTLPKLEDVESGLEKFIENKEKAEKLEKEIQETDNEIDAIVFDLYDINEEEVKTVLDSLDTENEIKNDIINKFKNLD